MIERLFLAGFFAAVHTLLFIVMDWALEWRHRELVRLIQSQRRMRE